MRTSRALLLTFVLLLTPTLFAQYLRYETEYPAIGYSTNSPTDTIAKLQEAINNDEIKLEFEAKTGYLSSLLQALKIDSHSQLLVFSKSSFQTGLISSKTPRALYFNDDTYVGWVQRGPNIEISSVDKRLGPVFYTLRQEERDYPILERKNSLCLRCHDTYSLTGGGVPRYLMGSGLTNKNGQTVFHAGWHLTSDQTPLKKRWGGWYVTGTHGKQRHLGNLIVAKTDSTKQLDLETGANIIDLNTLIDTTPYISQHSDIVALLIMEHQIHVQNVLTRVNYDTVNLIHNQQKRKNEREASEIGTEKIVELTEPLVRALLLSNEAPLVDPISGFSNFAVNFVNLGPKDKQGRSLRELDLTTRLFQYPCSYLIYSESFKSLPNITKRQVYSRLWEILSGEDQSKPFDHLSNKDRAAILKILMDTDTNFTAAKPTRKIAPNAST